MNLNPTAISQKISSIMSGTKEDKEQEFTIQPHPATTNNPETDPALQAGSGKASATGARDPYVPSKDIAESLEKPKSREELQAASAALNK
ncbi:hypothetical protein BDY24DRAFT_416805 [Mrakia frigida]|uniref:uncharacterized protein n=1 Tax=Mrakia frigida TaxID=29902 RepID=UPI003FCC0AF0